MRETAGAEARTRSTKQRQQINIEALTIPGGADEQSEERGAHRERSGRLYELASKADEAGVGFSLGSE